MEILTFLISSLTGLVVGIIPALLARKTAMDRLNDDGMYRLAQERLREIERLRTEMVDKEQEIGELKCIIERLRSTIDELEMRVARLASELIKYKDL